MWRYVLKRLLAMIPMLFGAAVLTFALMRLIPGDICYMRLAAGGGSVSADVLDGCRVQLGLDQPVWRQFLEYVWGLVRFDFGLSMWTGRPIVQEIALRFELSLQVAIMATLTAIALAIPMGVISAVKQNCIKSQINFYASAKFSETLARQHLHVTVHWR
jgi:peptide/nickel transport system permease protein